jgi:aspartyl protease family protein
MGCSPAISREHIRIITGSGYLIAPTVQVTWFQCLGQKIDRMTVVAHTLPVGSVVDGLLGMDFLASRGVMLHTAEGSADIPWKGSQ